MLIREIVQTEEDYRGQHQAPGREDGAPLWDVTRNGIYPRDFYQTYWHYRDSTPATDIALSTILGYRNKPNRQKQMYRAIPKGLPRGTKIRPGDWVTIIRRYALEHGRANLGNNFRIISAIATARDLFTDGNSPVEWGYDPQPRIPIGVDRWLRRGRTFQDHELYQQIELPPEQPNGQQPLQPVVPPEAA